MMDFFFSISNAYIIEDILGFTTCRRVDSKRIRVRKGFWVSGFREIKIFQEIKLRFLGYSSYRILNRKRGNRKDRVLGFLVRVYFKPDWIWVFYPNRSITHYTKLLVSFGFFARSESGPTRFYRCGFGTGHRVRIICPGLSRIKKHFFSVFSVFVDTYSRLNLTTQNCFPFYKFHKICFI